MGSEKTNDLQESCFCSWKDDLGEIHATYVTLQQINDTYIEIETKGNRILIPMHRVLKVKRKVQ